MKSDVTESLELLHAVRRGEHSHLDPLLERYQERLLARIRLMMGTPARRVAESVDFLQGALIEAARDIDRAKIDSEAQLLRWMTEIARNNIRDAVRRKRERLFSEFSASLAGDGSPRTPSSLAADGDERHRLAERIELLPDDLRRVIELRHFDDLSFREIGDTLGRTENAAQLLHARALVRLGELLERAS